MKICYICKKEKELNQFSKDKYTKDGLVNKCKKCATQKGTDYYYKNLEKCKKRNREYTIIQAEKISKRKKEYYLKNKELLKKKSKEKFQLNKKYYANYIKKRRHEDNQFRLRCNFSSYLSRALHGKKMGKGWETMLGYKLQDLINHLEKQFKPGMNWNNYGKYWDVDHKRPISWYPKENFLDGWKLSNLQPLESSINSAKMNRYEDK